MRRSAAAPPPPVEVADKPKDVYAEEAEEEGGEEVEAEELAYHAAAGGGEAAFADLDCAALGVAGSGAISFEVTTSDGSLLPLAVGATISSSLLAGKSMPLTPLQQSLWPCLAAHKDIVFPMRTYKVRLLRGGGRGEGCHAVCVPTLLSFPELL